MIVRKNKPVERVFGGGVLDFMYSSVHKFDKMPEFHARSYLFGQKHNFTGPKTHLDDRMEDIEKRIPKPHSKPIGKIDEYSMHHDLDFDAIKKSYDKTKKTPHDKKHHMKLIHEADERFIRGMQTPQARKDDPIVSRISEYAIKGKRWAEQKGILPTEYISGIGVKEPRKRKADPAKRLRLLINKSHNTEKDNSSKKYSKPESTKYIIKKLLENKIISI